MCRILEPYNQGTDRVASGCVLQLELGRLVLKRFLLLVLLLDKAATHLTAAFRTPLLFKLTASIKSSRQVSGVNAGLECGWHIEWPL